ncbi:hypothetical protein BSKO_03791 [Bryopsis sp. KO-2023]|nr:hypothetical protein BSKO_03791 [Bryopsis sp. KO-2023]
MALLVQQSVLDSLSRCQSEGGFAWLIGYVDSDVHVVGVSRSVDSSGAVTKDLQSLVAASRLESCIDDAARTLPHGLCILGGALISETTHKLGQEEAKHLVDSIGKAVQNQPGCSVTDAYAGCWNGGDLVLFKGVAGQQEDFEVSSDTSPFSILRCMVDAKVPVYLPKGSDLADSWGSAVDVALSDILGRVPSMVFQGCPKESASKAKCLLVENTAGTVQDLIASRQGWIDISAGLIMTNPQNATANGSPLTLKYQKIAEGKPHSVLWCQVGIDTLACVDPQLSLGRVGDVMKAAFRKTAERTVLELAHHPSCKKAAWYHFSVAHLAHPVSLFYPSRTLDEDLLSKRKATHQAFLLPQDRPLFRKGCAVDMSNPSGGRLKDVHLMAKPLGMTGGLMGMVDGSYEYCHYMQDKFNDSGWGCAYRSFQTVFSWFRCQHYTEKEIPSHRKIQETLVDIGDKEPAFVGSKEWIGSIEVGFVLEELLGVGHRVVIKSAAQEPASVARDLIHHFRTEGTPVSIGGGVLAYTLLGVSLNESTGEVAFLILDPHYTGDDDIDKICRGGWIAWKKPTDKAAAGGPLFAPNTFYNFMCPKRPHTI